MSPRTVLHQGRHATLVIRDGWEYVERVGVDLAAVVVAVTPAGELLLVEQYRIPVQASVIELPAGLVGDVDGPADDALDTARRELLEETGHTAERFELLAQGPVTPGITNEQVAMVRAHNLTRVAPGGGVPGENITVHAIPLAQVPAWLNAQRQRGALIDPKVYAGLYFAGQG